MNRYHRLVWAASNEAQKPTMTEAVESIEKLSGLSNSL